MSGKRSLFDVIENGKEIEKDLNLTSMEKISKGVDKLIEMTDDAFKHIELLEDAISQTDALASKTKRELESHICEDINRYGELAMKIEKMSDRLSVIQECMVMSLEQAGRYDMVELLRGKGNSKREEEVDSWF